MPEITKGYSLSHAFKFYKKKHYKRGDKYEINKDLYRKICCDFNKEIVQLSLKGKLVALPHSIGRLWCKKFKINWNNPPVDLNASKKAGKTVFHLNDHSDNWCVRWAWTKRNNLIANLIFYSFKPTRTNSRELAKIMKVEGGYKRFFS